MSDVIIFTNVIPSSLYDHTDLMLLLLSHGANVHSVTESGDTCLHGAVFGNNETIIKTLLANGKDNDSLAEKHISLFFHITMS